MGKLKGPTLRGLALHPRCFHNGSATTLMDVPDFHDTRFNIGMSDGQKRDLVAFLSALRPRRDGARQGQCLTFATDGVIR